MAIFLATTLLVTPQCDQSENTDGPYNGYCDNFGNRVPGLITNDTWMTPAPTYVSGKMVFYGPYAMRATAEYRNIDYAEEHCIGGISLMSPYNIGDKAWIKVDRLWYGPFCVVDCARRGDMYSIVVHREEVVEVNHEFATQMGMVTPNNTERGYDINEWYLDVSVLVNVSPMEYFYGDFEKAVMYKDFFLDTLEFATGYEPRVIQIEDNLWKEYGIEKYWQKN
jgi:hypothetical protein